MTATDTGPQTATGRWLDEIAPQLWRQPSNRSMPMDPMQLEIRKAVRAIEAEAQRLTVERFDQQAAELVACELTLVDTVSGNAMHAIRTSDVRSFVDAIRAALAHPEEERSGE